MAEGNGTWRGRPVTRALATWFDQLMLEMPMIEEAIGRHFIDVTLTYAKTGSGKPPIVAFSAKDDSAMPPVVVCK